ncbi:RNase H domain-containing protein [Trichonephila clavipes]|nr:RNase H domain-containing protein [Trichonephila clavipes]
MTEHLKLLKQLALEVIDGIPLDSVKIYTDGRLPGNEVADDLAKVAASDSVDLEDHMVLTSTEFYSRAKELLRRAWVLIPVHPWYFERHPGFTIPFKGSRSYKTALLRFSTGHSRCMNFEGGKRSFPIRPKCNISPFSPQHILQCLRFSCGEAVASPLLFSNYTDLWAHGSDLVSLEQMEISHTTNTPILTRLMQSTHEMTQ